MQALHAAAAAPEAWPSARRRRRHPVPSAARPPTPGGSEYETVTPSRSLAPWPRLAGKAGQRRTRGCGGRAAAAASAV
jgi:hypothetical protein